MRRNSMEWVALGLILTLIFGALAYMGSRYVQSVVLSEYLNKRIDEIAQQREVLVAHYGRAGRASVDVVAPYPNITQSYRRMEASKPWSRDVQAWVVYGGNEEIFDGKHVWF